MKLLGKKHFVFDLDDTLVDGREFCGLVVARTIRHFHPDISEESVISYHDERRGGTIFEIYAGAVKRFELQTSVEELMMKDSETMLAELNEIKLFHGVTDIMTHLRDRDKKLHICTNRKSESLIPILKNNGILEYFDSVVSCIDRGFSKPNPTCLLELVSNSKDPKASFIYFGDSEVDYLFAKNAGIEHIIFDQYLNGKDLFKKLINLFAD